MSSRSKQGRPERTAAREKAAAMRIAAERKEKRRRAILVAVTAVVVLVLVLTVGLVIRNAGQSADAPAAQPSNVTDGGIVVGPESAPVTVTTYLDYQCPVCKVFEETNSSLLAELRDSGQVNVEYKPISILDRMSGGTEFSSRAAGAAACVADEAPDAFAEFNDLMFANQPAEGGSGLGDEQIVDYATQAGAPPSVTDCITEGRYVGWAQDVTQTALSDDSVVEGGIGGTPTVILSGPGLEAPQEVQPQTWQSPDAFRQAIEAAAGA